MKNVFGFNVQTGETDSNKFKVKETPKELTCRLDEKTNNFSQMQKSAIRFPAVLMIIGTICASAGMIALALFFDVASETDIAEAYGDCGWMIYLSAPLILIGAALTFFNTRKLKSLLNNPAYMAADAEIEKLEQRCFDELGVPANADKIDVFQFRYKVKNGNPKSAASTRFTNAEMRIFRTGETLFIADAYCLYAFPVRAFTLLARIDKYAAFDDWNKDVDCRKGEYRNYKIRNNTSNNSFLSGYSVKPYYSARFIAFGEEYEIIIPAYEQGTFMKYVNTVIGT